MLMTKSKAKRSLCICAAGIVIMVLIVSVIKLRGGSFELLEPGEWGFKSAPRFIYGNLVGGGSKAIYCDREIDLGFFAVFLK
jgi:hypothetical protein